MKKNDTGIHLQTLRFFWQHVWRYPGYVVGLFVAVPLTILVYHLVPNLILARVLSQLAHGDFQPHHVWANFGPSLLAYAVLMIVGGLLSWRIVDHLGWKLEGKVERDIAQRIFSHLLTQSANFHANRFGGSLVSQSNKLLGGYVRFADTTIFQVLPLLSAITWVTVILLPRAPQYAVVLLLFSLFFMASSLFVTRRTRQIAAAHAATESKQTGYLADAVTNIMAIKSFAGGRFENKAFAAATEKTHANLLGLMHTTQRQNIFFSLINNIIYSIALVMAVVSVVIFKAEIGTVFLILSYTSYVVIQLWQFGNGALKNYNRALGDAQEMVETLNLAPDVTDPAQPEVVRITKGAVRFRAVNFTHPESGANETLFVDFNLEIVAGEKIGLVGHSGSGKTTFTKLLLRFNDVDAGQILIDGQNIAAITQDDLRRHISYVPQEPLLFHRSIRENIAYGKPSATDEEVRGAAQKAYADEFIQKLPKGYNTLVGERGVKLSGGQRQRIAIARAILKDAPILVLDEATSALDSESERLIQEALRELMKNRTAIVIAHRLSTIQKMDKIVVLDNGKIVEQGTHQSLLAQGKTYARLWKHQSGGFIEE